MLSTKRNGKYAIHYIHMHTYEAKAMWFLLFIIIICIITSECLVFVNAFLAVLFLGLFTLELSILTCCDNELIKSRCLSNKVLD